MPSRKQTRNLKPLLFLCGAIILCGCVQEGKTVSPTPTTNQSLLTTQTLLPTPTAQPVRLWLDPVLPQDFQDQFANSPMFTKVEVQKDSQIQITLTKATGDFHWVYALVAPFPTVMDGVTRANLLTAWKGNPEGTAIQKPILLSEQTKEMLTSIFGSPSKNGVKVMPEDEVLAKDWQHSTQWAIIPFEEIQPEWKVMKIDGLSPLHRDQDIGAYPLTVNFGFAGDPGMVQEMWLDLQTRAEPFLLTNRDESFLTVVMLTGTTALTRDTGKQMDAKGVLYPGQDIRSWFKLADIVHISNEVSFKQGCDLLDRGRFCSKPEYLDLLRSIGANVIELTGNHLMDFGADVMNFSLSLYMQAGIPYYGGGSDLAEARLPYMIQDHGNKIAFLGCNYGFPDFDMATATSPGANPCDREWIKTAIQSLKSKGYAVIFTYQDMESCTMEPLIPQKGDFYRAAEAGATIVSGSQSHCPQAMEFHAGAFIHYGLGNLFFDQTSLPETQEMLDLHFFYQNRYLGSELLTARLEDKAKPSPMSERERVDLLTQIFESSGWGK